MSLMVGSLSSGAQGPRPVISSRISETKAASSCVFSASRSASTYCDTSCWTCRRVSSSGSFSSAERLISSISRRCSRTLASSSLSLSSRSAAACGCNCGAGSAVTSGGAVHAAPPSADGADSSTAGRSGAATRRRRVAAPDLPAVEESAPSALGGAAWTAPPEVTADPAPQLQPQAAADRLLSDKLLDAKVRLHRRLIEEINLSALEKLPEEETRRHVQQLVSQYVLAERLALN